MEWVDGVLKGQVGRGVGSEGLYRTWSAAVAALLECPLSLMQLIFGAPTNFSCICHTTVQRSREEGSRVRGD